MSHDPFDSHRDDPIRQADEADAQEPVPAVEPVTIDVVSDVVCPWCYVGKRRLDKALEMQPETPVVVRWRPFQLDPTIPAGGHDRKEYMTRKFGDRLAEVHARLVEIGREEDIPFAFDAIRRSPNTLDAHRLIRWSWTWGVQGALVESLFSAFFVEGLDIGDLEVLADRAALVGMDREEAADFLRSAEAAPEVQREIEQAQQVGVQGVPFFIFAGRYAASGAQPADVLAGAIAQAFTAGEADEG
jgi:predicted DsbA family dithiol-disulfide isomerase